MKDKEYFELGWQEQEKGKYDPYRRYNFLKENFEEVQLLNGHTLYIKLKNGETIELCDTGFSASWVLLDFVNLVNKKEN